MHVKVSQDEKLCKFVTTAQAGNLKPPDQVLKFELKLHKEDAIEYSKASSAYKASNEEETKSGDGFDDHLKVMVKVARKQDDLFTQLGMEFEDFEQAREFYKNDVEFRFET